MEENKKVNEQIKTMQTNSEAKAQSPKAEATQANEKKETAPRINTKPQEAKIEKNTMVKDDNINFITADKENKTQTKHDKADDAEMKQSADNEQKAAKHAAKPMGDVHWSMYFGWDIGLAVIMALLSCLLIYRIYDFSIVSFQWIWKIALVFVIINIIFILLLLLKKLPNWSIWLRRAVIILLCCGLSYGSVVVNNLESSLQEITKPETATTVNVSLITKKDGGARTLGDLSGKKIGIQNANDTANSSYVKEQLSKESELKNVTYVEELDYESLYKKLISEDIDALIITDYYFKTLLKDHYPTIEDDIFILKSYQKERENDISTSNKDIRYEPFTVYIAGVDEGDDPSIDARSDVNIVLMVNPLANHIEMVSIPRDAFVPNPALNSHNDKLTHLGLSGIKNSMKGIEEVFGFEIDYYVKLNFFSVIDIVDAIGLIEVDVPISFCEQDEHRSFAKKDLICLNKGKQKLNGKQALAFARHRKSYTDVLRGKAQQEVIKGIINVLTTPSGVANINNVLSIASKAVSTNMPMQQVTNFVSAQLDNLKPWTIESIILENGADARLVTASMPGQELYVMLLNRLDVQVAFDAYQSMLNQMQFNAFSFRLDSLNQNKAQIPNNDHVVWAGSNVNSYKLNEPVKTPETNTPTKPSEEKPKPDETTPEKPVTPQPEEPDTPANPTPDVPEQPEDPNPQPPNPDVPTTPEQPDGGNGETASNQ